MLGKIQVANQIALNRATIKPYFTVGIVRSRHATTILLAFRSNFLIWFLLIVSVVCLMR